MIRIRRGLSARVRHIGFWLLGAAAMPLAAAPVITRQARAQEAAGALTVEQAIALALQRDERVRQSELQAQSAESRRARAEAFFFPQLTLTGNYLRRPQQIVRQVGTGPDARPVTIQRYNALSGDATLLLPLFAPTAIPLYRQARLEKEAAQLSAAEQRRLVGFEAADAFVAALSAQEIERAAARRLSFARERLKDAQARSEAGLVSSNDVTRGELELANAEREASLAAGQRELARTQLGHFLIANITGELAMPAALLAAAAEQPLEGEEAQLAQSQQQRLDLQAADKLVLAAEEAAKEPRLRVLPRLTAQATGRYTNEPGLVGRSFNWLAGATLSWALWDGGVRAAEGRERDAAARAEALGQSLRRRNALLDVRQARLALLNARGTQAAARRAREMAARHAEETAELYRQGLVRALEVADANLRLFEAEVTSVRDQYALVVAFLDLKVAVGERPPGVK